MPTATANRKDKGISAVADANAPVLDFAPSKLTADAFRVQKVRSNPYDDIVLQSRTDAQPYEAPVPHAAGADVNAEVEAQLVLLKAAARYHKVRLVTHVIEGKTDADRRIWFLAKPRAVRQPKAGSNA